jgi:hypothetical protein
MNLDQVEFDLKPHTNRIIFEEDNPFRENKRRPTRQFRSASIDNLEIQESNQIIQRSSSFASGNELVGSDINEYRNAYQEEINRKHGLLSLWEFGLMYILMSFFLIQCSFLYLIPLFLCFVYLFEATSNKRNYFISRMRLSYIFLIISVIILLLKVIIISEAYKNAERFSEVTLQSFGIIYAPGDSKKNTGDYVFFSILSDIVFLTASLFLSFLS